MKNTLVSIVVPVYNAQLYLAECLDSIRNQTYTYLEIILVNDGSTDNSQKICDEYEKKDKRVIVINQENKGVVSARKLGTKRASGKYIAFIDADDYIAQEYIETMLNNIGNSDLATSSLILNKGVWEDQVDEGIYEISDTSVVIKNMIYKEGTSYNGLVTHITNKLFKTIMAKNVMDIVDDAVYYGEDAEFIYKYIIRAKQITITKYKGYFYRENNSSITHDVHSDFLINVNRLYLSLKEDFEKCGYSSILMPQLEKWIAMHIRLASQKMGFHSSNINYLIPCKAKICNKTIIIYGAGNVGKDYIRQIKKEKLCKDYIWVDKNYIHKENWMGTCVQAPSNMLEYGFDYVVIAVNNENTISEIVKELVAQGVDYKKIIAEQPLSIGEFYL